MPNWVKSQIVIEGNPEDILKIKSLIENNDEWREQVRKRNEGLPNDFQIKVSDSSDIDFNRLIPTPTNIFQGDIGIDEEEKYGKENCWYDWNYKHWGTKWNACDAYITLGADKDNLTINMSTAWCPALYYVEELSRLVLKNNCVLRIAYHY